jgi:hypothetical protein
MAFFWTITTSTSFFSKERQDGPMPLSKRLGFKSSLPTSFKQKSTSLLSEKGGKMIIKITDKLKPYSLTSQHQTFSKAHPNHFD